MPSIPEPEPDIPKGAPSASNADRFANDRFLRLKGWQIHARPRKGPALWRKGERVLAAGDALAEECARKKA